MEVEGQFSDYEEDLSVKVKSVRVSVNISLMLTIS